MLQVKHEPIRAECGLSLSTAMQRLKFLRGIDRPTQASSGMRRITITESPIA
jgi:hypothetical protein